MICLFDNIWGILIAIGAVFLYTKMKQKLDYFADRGMPFVRPSWIEVFKSISLKNITEMPMKFYDIKSGGDSPYIGYFTFFKPAVLVLEPGLAENVLIKDFSYFHDHGFDVDIESNPLAGHLFNMKGDQWRTLRHKLVPTFTSGKLRGMVPIMEECADKLIWDMNQDPSLKKDTNLKDLFKKYSLSVIARCAFGIDPESVEDPNSEFRRVMNTIFIPSKITQLKLSLLITLPFISRFIKIPLFPQEVEDFFLSFTRQSFEMRKKSGIKSNDFIQLLLELKEKGHVDVDVKDLEQEEKDNIESLKANLPSAKLELTEELLMAQAFVFLVGGYENTAYLVAIATYVLSKHPDIQTRVRQEVQQAREQHKSLNYLALRDMKLLEACIDEALRLYAPVPSLIRQCTKTYTFSDGIKLDKGTTVVLPAKSFHHDAKYWPNPEEFNPDRFLNKENIRPGTYMPFGDGPRICIGIMTILILVFEKLFGCSGMQWTVNKIDCSYNGKAQRMAILVTKVMVAKLLENFRLLPSCKTKEPAEVELLTTSDIVGGVWGSFGTIQ